MGSVVLSNRERAIIIQPMDLGLRGITLRYTQEMRSEAQFFAEILEMILPEEMLSVAEHIVDWRPRMWAAAMNAHIKPFEFGQRLPRPLLHRVMRALIAFISSPAGDQGGWEAGARGL